MRGISNLNSKTLATVHGSAYSGDCVQALHDLHIVMKEELGEDKLVMEG